MILHRTYREQIYPTVEQVARLIAWSCALRFLWNLALDQRLAGLRRFDKKYYTAFDQINELTQLRAELPWLADVPRNVCADVMVQMDLAWQRCFKGLAERPQYKSKYRDFPNPKETHNIQFEVGSDYINFPKLGRIRAVIHRPIIGKQKTCMIVRDGDQWFACIAVEQEITDPVPREGPAVGIDRGIVNIVADSDGGKVPNPKFAEKLARHLAYYQRAAARKQKGSKNSIKAKIKVARIKRKVRRQRDHFLHCLSKQYANSHGVVVMEDLEVQNMMRSASGTVEKPGKNVAQKRGLNRGIAGAGWGKLDQYLGYKMPPLGGRTEKVPAAYSSQTCAKCQHCSPLNRRSQSEFVCMMCGHTANADTNAAQVILSRRVVGSVCGGQPAIGLPKKQKLRVVRRGRRSTASAAS